jgi:hypothetical protein
MEAVIRLIERRPAAKRIAASIFELAVALSWVLVGLSIIPDRQSATTHSLIGHSLGIFTTAWSVLFVVGGALVIWGITMHSFRARIAGLTLLSSGLLMEGIAALTVRLEPRVFVYFVYAGACAFRALHLTTENRIAERRQA